MIILSYDIKRVLLTVYYTYIRPLYTHTFFHVFFVSALEV